MARLLYQKIKNCGECPFSRWKDDYGSVYTIGYLSCAKKNEIIGYDDKNHPTPEWCPLPTISTERRT